MKITIPEHISTALELNEAEASAIINEASRKIVPYVHKAIQLSYIVHGPVPDLKPEEKAQSMVFSNRFDHLPEIDEFTIVESDGRWFINEIDAIRAALNEYRTVFYNRRDAIHFRRIRDLYRSKLFNRDESPGLAITVENERGEDVTLEYVEHIDSNFEAIIEILQKSDFDYLFNGVLQHSDSRFAKRLIEEYTNGKLNYVFLRNLTLAREIKSLFRPYYQIVNVLSFPRMGSL